MKRSIVLALLLANAACSPSSTTSTTTQSASGTLAGVDQALINKAVKPGDDFNTYASGAWFDKAEIPADRSSTGVGYDVFKVAEARNAGLIQAALKANAAAGTDERRIADYYTAFTDMTGIEQRGMAPLKGQLDAIAALRDKGALSALLGATMRADTDPLNASNFHTENLFGLFVTQDLNRPDVTVPYLMQGGIGLPDRDYYLSTTPEMASLRTAYKAYVARLLTLAGVSDAAARTDRIIALETKIATAHYDILTSQDAHQATSWKRDDFAKKAPGIDWNAYWNSASLPSQQDFSLWQPGAITKLSALVASEPMEAWQDWLTFHTINQVTAALPKAIDDASFDFNNRTLNGTPQQQPRDKRAIASVNAQLGDAVGQIYVGKYFPASSKTEIQGMVKNIVAAFDNRLAKLEWLSPATKAEGRKKLQVLIVGVGYPDKWRDYSALEIKADDPVGNLQRARLAEYQHQIAKIGKPVDRSEWWMTPQTVNAVNLPVQNALNFPAAILETPYFDAKFDAAANYGAIGAVIGHEISHSFDNLGADFDSTGRLHNWWTPADLKHFEAAGAALAAQYDAYEALPGLHLNGKQELGENIADVAGLTASYEAYRASLGGKEAPVIDGLTGDQRFFLAFGQSWRTKMREKALRARIATDVHAPAPWRVQTVRNLDAWYAAFDVKPDQKLYLTPDKRVKVW
ncbi:M13 family metallopeptidase [Sphingomonas sp. So64.6b]|uniref:M13 family metallopeptidase n=1 Tax=Sphingomonas sp. So64.6b TaxID=2997354 RepID=UPI00160023A0|nr:M13 family metallopeptidase [Sphingomonas sp. So64.6b]QNA84501.1 M13 family metallopeptidase [Sphingomonas sp. So64.6b]